MSEQWVIGRYVDGRWGWLSSTQPDNLNADLTAAYVFACRDDADHDLAFVDHDGLFSMLLYAAKAIAERWAK